MSKSLAVEMFDMFGLVAPVSLDQLKSAYRAAARKLHPDLNPNDPLAETKFKQMDSVYQRLQKDPAIFTIESFKNIVDRTEDGVLLSELGLGLGPLKNGIDCTYCKHKGYLERTKTIYSLCPKCKGYKHNGYCFYCFNGQIPVGERLSYVTCHVCLGTGEIEIHNPVIPKGWLGGTQSQKERKRANGSPN